MGCGRSSSRPSQPTRRALVERAAGLARLRRRAVPRRRRHAAERPRDLCRHLRLRLRPRRRRLAAGAAGRCATGSFRWRCSSNVLHLDCALALIKPGLLVWCPQKLIDGLPMSLRDWDKIDGLGRGSDLLATNGLVLEEGRVIVDADNARVIERAAQAQGRRHPAARSTARSAPAAACAAPTIRCCARACWLTRRPVLGVRSKTTGLGLLNSLLAVDAERADDDRHLTADEAQQHDGERPAAGSRRRG